MGLDARFLFSKVYPNTDGVCLYAEESELERFVLATVVGRKQSESSFFIPYRVLCTIRNPEKLCEKHFRFKSTFIRTHVHAHIGQSPVSFGVTLEEGGRGK